MLLYARGIVPPLQVTDYCFRWITLLANERTTNDIVSVNCLQGDGLDRSFAFAISQMILDITGDLLSESSKVCMLHS